MMRSLSLVCPISALLCGAALAAPSDAPLFKPAPAVPGFAQLSLLDERTDVVRSRYVSFDDGQVASPRSGPTTARLNLFDDITVDVVFEREEAGLGVDRVLYGRVADAEPSYVIFVETDGHVWADVWTLDAGRYEIRNAGPGVHLVAQVAGLVAPCGQDLIGPNDLGMVPPEAREPEAPPAPEAGPRDTADLIDVLIMYTAAARAQAGGTTNITNAMNGWMATTNQFYTNSQMIQRVRLVHLVETDYVEAPSNQNSIVTDRDRFRLNNDGFMDNVHTLRNTFGADLCQLVSRSNSSSICGIAASLSINQSLGFAVTRYVCGAYTFAHEMGHNMGCAHDRPNAGGGGGAFCYSFGHRTTGNPQYITVMSYPPGQEVPYFSNPNITLSGQTLGIADPPGCANATAADNSRSMNGTALSVANYRQATVGNPPPASFDLMSPTDGAQGVGLTPVLSWEAAEFATQYDVTLSTEADMTPVLWADDNVLTTSVLVPAGLLDNCETFYWQVVASGFGGSTSSSPAPASFTTALVGDINNSGIVDFNDLNQLIFQYGSTSPSNPADLDDDGDVDFADLNLVLSNYNQSC